MIFYKTKIDENNREWTLKRDIVKPTEDCFYESFKWNLPMPKAKMQYVVSNKIVGITFDAFEDAKLYFDNI